jgi:hypothetical protein
MTAAPKTRRPDADAMVTSPLPTMTTPKTSRLDADTVVPAAFLR